MRTKPAALLIRLADSDADAQSIERFAEWVRKVGPLAVADAVMHLRHVAQDRTSDRTIRSVRVRSVHDRPRGNSAAVQRAASILRRELGLSVESAAGLLIPMLGDTVGGLPRDVSPRHKEGFEKWLARLTKFVSPSQLLHVVTTLRNSAAHDWPLRQRV